MKLKLIIGIIPFLLCRCAQDSERKVKEPDGFGEQLGVWPMQNFKGKIKVITEYRIKDYSMEDGNVILSKASKEIVSSSEYTQEGYVISKKYWSRLWNRFPDQHSLLNVYLFRNRKPFKLVTRDKSNDREYPLTRETTVKCDLKGNTIEQVWEEYRLSENYGVRNRDFKYFRYTTYTEFDEYNCPINVKRFDQDNQLEYEIRNKYNAGNLLILEEKYDVASKLISKKELRSVENVNWYLTTRYDGDSIKIDDSDQITSVMKDSYGNILEEERKSGWKVIYKYQNKKQIGYENYDNGKFYSSNMNNYREDGILLGYIEINTDPYYEKKSVVYKIDEIGNWTEEIIFDEHNKIKDATYRVINYY